MKRERLTTLSNFETPSELPDWLPVLFELWRDPGLRRQALRNSSERAIPGRPRCSERVTEEAVKWLISAGLLEFHSTAVRGKNGQANIGGPPLMITPSGLALVERVIAALDFSTRLSQEQSCEGGARVVPCWDARTRELHFRGRLVKRFRKSAPNQERILETFQEQRWPQRIDDPLPRDAPAAMSERLHDTIKHLNRGLHVPVVRFGGDGKGRGVCWRDASPPPQDEF